MSDLRSLDDVLAAVRGANEETLDRLARELSDRVAVRLVESGWLRQLVKEVTTRAVLHFEALARLDRVKVILEHCRERGVRLRAANGRVWARGKMNTEIHALLVLYREDLLRHLQREQRARRDAERLERQRQKQADQIEAVAWSDVQET